MIAGWKRGEPASAPVAALVAIVGAVALAPSAGAQQPPSPPADPGAAVNQYRESIPGATGPVLPAAPTAPRGQLDPAVSRQLEAEGGRDAPLLRRIATSADYGAPEPRAGSGARGEARGSTGTRRPAVEDQGVGASLVGAAGHGGWRTLGLGVLMLVSAAGVVAARSRARQRVAGPHS